MNPTHEAFTALFNELKRGVNYVFLHVGGHRTEGVLHGYMPDGTLQVAALSRTVYLNPAHIMSATESRR